MLIADERGYCTTEILSLKASPHIDNRYLFYWLKHPAFLKYVEAESHGMNMPCLGTETGKTAPFVLAPRNEQTRIANQLDTLLTRAQACNDRFDAIPALLKRFRQTVLTAASSGGLTSDWRESKPTEKIAQVMGEQAQHTLNKGLDSAYYRELVLQHLRNFTACKREELEAVLRAKLPDVLSDAQKRNRVKNLLADLSRRNLIAPERKGPGARWRLVPQK